MKIFFGKIKKIWMAFAQKLARVNSVILLSAVYFLVVGLMALIARLFRKDLLLKKNKPGDTTYWLDRISSDVSVDRSKHQF